MTHSRLETQEPLENGLDEPARTRADAAAAILEIGLACVVVIAPLPFGSVSPPGRLFLEIASLVLLAVWLFRSFLGPARLPSTAAAIGLGGLLLLAVAQALPVGESLAAALSPFAAQVRRDLRPVGAALDAERRLLGADPAGLDGSATISVDPEATASAARTGAALVALFLVATTVVRTRGPVLLSLSLLVSASFQALYGVLILASADPMIWNVPKRYYRDCATGTFVNRNHFAGFLSAALPCGMALAISAARRIPLARGTRARILALSGGRGVQALLLALLILVGLAGLLLSFSRTGIALGMGGLTFTAFASGRRGMKARVLALALLFAVAAIPLAQIGAERLVSRYARADDDLAAPSGRATVWNDTLGMIRAAPVFGVGFGAFERAYPLFRSKEIRARYDHAHNDALQVVAEGGAVGAAFAMVLLLVVAKDLVRGLSGAGGALGVGIACGLGALLLHALVDFNFHIPANAATAAVLAGTLHGMPWDR